MNNVQDKDPNKQYITGKSVLTINKQRYIMHTVNKINIQRKVINMKPLDTKAIANSPIFNREKGVIDEIKNFTLEHATISESSDGEVIVCVTFKESPKRFWASGVFANFIMDNLNVDKVNDTDYDFSGYDIKVSFGGKKTSKNKLKYNVWEIKYNLS